MSLSESKEIFGLMGSVAVAVEPTKQKGGREDVELRWLKDGPGELTGCPVASSLAVDCAHGNSLSWALAYMTALSRRSADTHLAGKAWLDGSLSDQSLLNTGALVVSNSKVTQRDPCSQ